MESNSEMFHKFNVFFSQHYWRTYKSTSKLNDPSALYIGQLLDQEICGVLISDTPANPKAFTFNSCSKLKCYFPLVFPFFQALHLGHWNQI